MADSVVRLRIDTKEYDANIKRAGEALNRYFQTVKAGGGTLTTLDDGVMDAINALGEMSTKATSTKGRIKELTDTFVNLNVMLKNFTEEERQAASGQALSKALDALKERIKETRSQMSSAQGELTDWHGVLEGIGSKLGLNSDMIGLVTTGTIGMTAAVTAGVAAFGAAAKALDEYNAELARQDQVVSVTTGLQGPSADKMTNAGRAIAKVYGVDFREVINAANTLMTQFGQTGDQALQLIRDGMQGMIIGDGPKLLSMIQQFGPAFTSAGVSASQLVAVIQNSEGGIFTDQNMQAILMALPKIKMMSDSTAKALAGIGIDGKKMSADVETGAKSVFEALQEISQAIDDNKGKTRETGIALQEMFGRQARTAGDNLGKAIATLNTNLEETKRQTGGLGEALSALELANERLEGAMREVLKVDSWEELKTYIEADFLTAIADVIKGMKVAGEAVASAIHGISGALDWLEDMFGVFPKMFIPWVYGLRDAFKQLGADGLTALDGLKAAIAALLSPLSQILLIFKTLGSGSITGTIDELLNKAAADKAWSGSSAGAAHQYAMQLLSQTVTTPPEPPRPPKHPTGSTTTHQATPAEQAEKKFEAAESAYQQAVEFAAAQLRAKTISEQDYAKKILSAEEGLWKAIANARELADNPKYKTAQEAAEKRMGEQGVKVKELTEQLEARRKAEREAEAAAREKAQAEKKLMESLDEAATAYRKNNLGGYLSAMKKVGGDAGQGIAAGGFTATTGNISSFQGMLREQMAGAEVGSSLYAALSAQLADANALGNIISTAVKNGIDVTEIPTGELWKKIFSENPGDYIEDATWQELVDKINEELAKIGKDPIKIDVNTGAVTAASKQAAEGWKSAAQAVSAVGGALQQLEDPAAKVAGIVGQAIANIALGFAAATAKDSKTGVFGWIAAVAGGLGTMISTIAAIKSATSGNFAEGGIVPGNNLSGDNVRVYGLNSGELILNRSQQDSIAAQLSDGNSMGNLRLYTEVNGENLRIVMDNASLRRGRGRYVTTKKI